MTDLREGAEPPDDFTVRRVLREYYAAPAEAAYWVGLEAAILDHVRGHSAAAPGIVDFLARWSRSGLIAAGIAGLIATLAVSRARHEEAQVAFETVLRASSPVIAIQASSAKPMAREATLQYLIAP